MLLRALPLRGRRFVMSRAVRAFSDGNSPPPSSSSSSSSSEAAPLKERLKQTAKLYGLTATVFHSSVYVCALGATFAAVRGGLDTNELLVSWGLDPEMIPNGAGDLAAAWCICAVTGPARGLLTVTASPMIARIVKRRHDKKDTKNGEEEELMEEKGKEQEKR